MDFSWHNEYIDVNDITYDIYIYDITDGLIGIECLIIGLIELLVLSVFLSSLFSRSKRKQKKHHSIILVLVSQKRKLPTLRGHGSLAKL